MKAHAYGILFLIVTLIWISCSTVPITGRQQLNLISDSEMMAMSYQQYDQFLNESNVVTGTAEAEMVTRCGHNIQRAVEQYFSEKDMSNYLDGYRWEFNLIASDQVNAWCMPGGKVVIYSGILPVAQGETGLAVVMGHEVAHAVAEHGNERMSQAMLQQLGANALAVALQEKPEKTQQLWMAAYGVTTQVGAILPYSRLHETEADKLGLIFMAMAGYNPRAAVNFWQRMSEKGGQAPPEFLSTHPAGKTRIENIKKYLPTALEYYKE